MEYRVWCWWTLVALVCTGVGYFVFGGRGRLRGLQQMERPWYTVEVVEFNLVEWCGFGYGKNVGCGGKNCSITFLCWGWTPSNHWAEFALIEQVKHTDDIPVCVALKIDEHEFSIKFNWQKCMWITQWMWTVNYQMTWGIEYQSISIHSTQGTNSINGSGLNKLKCFPWWILKNLISPLIYLWQMLISANRC